MSALAHAGAKSGREYPERPIVGVAGIVIAEGEVLLIRRGRPPLLGAWSLPGGALKAGETMLEGVAREVLEETGVVVTPLLQIGTFDRIVRDESSAVRFHYVLLDWLCVVKRGDGGQLPRLCAGADALEAAWVSRERLRSMEGLDESAVSAIEEAFARPEWRS